MSLHRVDLLAERVLSRAQEPPNLEELLTSDAWFGLETATVVQRAICRWADGRPLGNLAAAPLIPAGYDEDVAERATWEWIVGALPDQKPREIHLIAGIRAAKSLIAACASIHAAQTVDLTGIRMGEVPRFSVLSLTRDNANAVKGHLLGAVQRSTQLRGMVLGDKERQRLSGQGLELTAGSLALRRPDGHIVEIVVVAGRRAGGSLVSRWSLGVVFDEAPRMVGSDEGVINFDDGRRAVLERLLPGAQLWAIGSPWAPLGPAYQAVQHNHGKPGEVLVIRAPGPVLNPFWWTQERCRDAKGHDLQTYFTDILAEFADLETSAYPEHELRRCVRDGPANEGPIDRMQYVAEMDPATRSNAWTLVIACEDDDGKRRVVYARQWLPGGRDNMPLQPRAVMRDIAEDLGRFGLQHVVSDQYASEAIVEFGREYGVAVMPEDWTGPSKQRAYEGFRQLLREGKVELPRYEPLLVDLQRVRRKLAGNSTSTERRVKFILPVTEDGRHCDFAPPVVRLLTSTMPRPLPEPEGRPEGWSAKEWEDVQREDEEMARDEWEQRGGGTFDDQGVFDA